MKISPLVRFAIAGGMLALIFTVLRYVIGSWHDDLPNTMAGFASAGVVGAGIGSYVALMTRKYGQLRAVAQKD